MNTDLQLSINKNLDPSIYYGYPFTSANDPDSFFFEEDELSEEQSALKKIKHGLSLNQQYQEKLEQLKQRIQAKIEKNNVKLEKVDEIIAFKNKRNKIQLKKKHIELYKYEDPKLPPESFRIFERIKHSKGKKSFNNLYKTMIQDSSSEEEGEEETKMITNGLEKGFKEDRLLGIENGGSEVKGKKKSEAKSLSNKSPRVKKGSVKKENGQEGIFMIARNKSESVKQDEEGEGEENDLDDEDDFEQDQDSEDEMKSFKKRGDRLGLDKYLEEYQGQEPVSIDWLGLTRKINLKLIANGDGSLVTALDLYRRFIGNEIQQKRVQWSEQDDKALLNAVKIHGTSNWKQVANNIEGKNTYLCFQRWAKFVNPNISKGKWRLEEDLRLTLAVECFKVGNWIEISSLFKNRTDVQCRERWCNILDPSLKGREWSKQEDELLLLGVSKYGPKWAQVSKMLKNRTDNQCWRRWKMLSKKSKASQKRVEIESPEPVDFKNVKINMSQPFKLLKKEVNTEILASQPSLASTMATQSSQMMDFPSPKEKEASGKKGKGPSKKELKSLSKAAKGMETLKIFNGM